MAWKDGPSYTDLVFEVVRLAGRPLTVQEILDEVSRRRPVTSRNPKGTIRQVLSQGRQLVGLGGGLYAWLPHLVNGSLLRLPLTEKKPANHPLSYPPEVRDALWPDLFETGNRRVLAPLSCRLPNRREATLSLGLLSPRVTGSSMPKELRNYLLETRATAGDSLLVRVVDLDERQCEMSFEPRRRRDKAAVAARSRELADAAYHAIRNYLYCEMPIRELDLALLARGFYHSNVAPDPLQTVLGRDSRFVDAGLDSWMLAEDVTPADEARIRDMKRFESEMSRVEEEPVPSVSSEDLRRAMEKTLTDVEAILRSTDFSTIEEANEFLQDLMASGGVPPREAETPLEKAQDIMYEAWGASSHRDRIRLARQALEVSPDCADAYVLLAEETARNAKEAADLYAKGVAAGERSLGESTFKEDAGHFWGIVETRPYMRARFGLAQALWAMGKREEAISHAWEMLRLNPGDNQGVRYALLDWLLELGEEDHVKRLLAIYPDDVSAIWKYGRALHLFRRAGDSQRARKARDEAIQENPYVPAYLLGRKRLPRVMPDLIGIGDEREAIDCAAGQISTWRKTQGALAWLQRGSGSKGARH